MVSDEQFSAGRYILLFADNVKNLRDHTAYYGNALLNLKTYSTAKNPNEAITQIEPDDQKNLLTIVNNTRFFVTQIYLSLDALKEVIPEFRENFNDIEKIHKKILTTPIPAYETILEFTKLSNRLFVKGIGKQLLMKSQDYVEQAMASTSMSNEMDYGNNE